jgi:hypothetical protein
MARKYRSPADKFPGKYKQINRERYIMVAADNSKGNILADRKRYGGRIYKLPKTSPYYQRGYRYGLYQKDTWDARLFKRSPLVR